ncbi:hypothetical protein [Streptomyces sp. NPDC058674]|uniref:hypothetical protein n=1 Tax=Streptomyces sp. NPDC058674 TaxID=3346592 RepID=UPI003668CC25
MRINRSTIEQAAPAALRGLLAGGAALPYALIGRLAAVPGGQGATAGIGTGWNRRGVSVAAGASAPAAPATGPPAGSPAHPAARVPAMCGAPACVPPIRSGGGGPAGPRSRRATASTPATAAAGRT